MRGKEGGRREVLEYKRKRRKGEGEWDVGRKNEREGENERYCNKNLKQKL